MRTLAIDFGLRRVGLAISDQGGQLATPLDVLTVTTPEVLIDQICQILKKEDVRRIVVGLPLNMDDSAGPMAKKVTTWARKLAQRAGLPLIYVDERLSSFEADQQLLDRKKAGEKLTRQRKKEQRDALAAAQFLQAFLDGQTSPIDTSGI